jgi:hypothetical protein
MNPVNFQKKHIPIPFTLVGVLLSDAESLPLENAPLLLLRRSQLFLDINGALLPAPFFRLPAPG